MHAGLSAAGAAILFGTGILAWSLVEYWLHRLFFHWVPAAKWGERMHFLVHGVHHTWPKDRYRLVMPPAVSLALFVAFLGLFLLLLGSVRAWAFHAGFTFGYMLYDMTHYYLHHFEPRTKWGRALKKHHMTHHFRDDTVHFGVSSPIWDWVFRTTQSRRPRRAHARHEPNS